MFYHIAIQLFYNLIISVRGRIFRENKWITPLEVCCQFKIRVYECSVQIQNYSQFIPICPLFLQKLDLIVPGGTINNNKIKTLHSIFEQLCSHFRKILYMYCSTLLLQVNYFHNHKK